MKILFYVLTILLLNIEIVQANTIYNTKGEVIENQADINMWPVQFQYKNTAEAQAKVLENGQVFQDQDTKLYQVWYGNVKITGMVVISSMNE